MKLTSYPHLVKEWHPTMNGDLTPEDITHGSKKKVWWLCSKGHSFDSMPKPGRPGVPIVQEEEQVKTTTYFIYFLKLLKNSIQLKMVS